MSEIHWKGALNDIVHVLIILTCTDNTDIVFRVQGEPRGPGPPVRQRPDGDRPIRGVRGLHQYSPGRNPQTEGNTSAAKKHLAIKAHLNRRLK